MARRIAEFSQRDHVPLGSLADGARFIYRGARWEKLIMPRSTPIGALTSVAVKYPGQPTESETIYLRIEGTKATPLPYPKLHTRVIVSRASREALRAQRENRS